MKIIDIIKNLNDLKSIPSLKEKIKEYEALQARRGLPATVQGFIFEYLQEAERYQ